MGINHIDSDSAVFGLSVALLTFTTSTREAFVSSISETLDDAGVDGTAENKEIVATLIQHAIVGRTMIGVPPPRVNSDAPEGVQ